MLDVARVFPMTTENKAQRVRGFAVLMVVCGLFGIAAYILPLVDAGPLLFHSSAVVGPAATAHAPLKPRASEWPLLVVGQFEAGRPPEPYTIQVSRLRETDLIELAASSNSPERSRALASWLGDSFVTGLRDSYSARGLTFDPSAQVRERPEDLPALSRWSGASVVLQVLTPSLLVAGGVILFRACREKHPERLTKQSS